jgi:hypothetical protein
VKRVLEYELDADGQRTGRTRTSQWVRKTMRWQAVPPSERGGCGAEGARNMNEKKGSATMLALAAAAIGAGIPLPGVTDESERKYTRGYKLGEGYNLTREMTRRLRQIRRDAGNRAVRAMALASEEPKP